MRPFGAVPPQPGNHLPRISPYADLHHPQAIGDITLWELENTERAAMNALMGAENVDDAARIYSEKFLRPGIPHLDRRISEANRLAGAGYENGSQARTAPEQSAAERPNPLRLAYNGLNADDFMVQTNRLAARPDAYTRYL